jgi:type VI protein secretion system component VasF
LLSGLVYVIGRSVIVRRVAPGRGLVPIWVSVGVFVVGLVVALVWTSLLVSDMVHMVPAPGTFSGGSGA